MRVLRWSTFSCYPAQYDKIGHIDLLVLGHLPHSTSFSTFSDRLSAQEPDLAACPHLSNDRSHCSVRLTAVSSPTSNGVHGLPCAGQDFQFNTLACRRGEPVCSPVPCLISSRLDSLATCPGQSRHSSPSSLISF